MKLVFAGVCIIVLLALPFGMSSYYTNIASQILIAAILAMSLNLLVGYAGMISLGHAAYLGVAAYATAWLMLHAGLGPLAAGAAALAITLCVAAFYGLLALRASGLGFLMITLALGEILWGLAYRWVGVTGGDNGLSGLSRPTPFGVDLDNATAFYFFTLIVFAIAFGLIALIMRSPFGASVLGTRDQPRRMSALGYNVWLIRWLVFLVAGFWGAVSGVLYVYYNNFISPHALSLTQSAEALLMVIAGGPATLLGPVVGAAVVVYMKNVASAYVERWTMLLGVVFVLIVLFLPDGLVPGLARLRARWLHRSLPRAR